MTYQVLARKWRPQDFSSLIGQEPIVTALRNALADGKIAQAYLFSGIRGVGKTSAARVLAKALNCEKGPAADPCNACPTCEQITRGADLDVLEIDAATYSKVEQVRELTESLRYGPARNRYKVVVLDEVHRLSRQAFDALLKIVEEPPPHLVFIFATTEIEAVPATILSRCQEFHFHRVRTEVVAHHLRALAEAEEIEASDATLRLVARAGEGSVRDAIALFDQLAAFGSGRVDENDALALLGGVDHTLFLRLLTSIVDGNAQDLAAAADQIDSEGADPRQLFGRFLTYCRDALHLSFGAAPESIDLPPEAAENLARIAERTGYENLLRLLHHLLASEALLRRTEVPSLALEIALLRAAELPKLIAVEALLAGQPLSRSGAATSAAPTGPRPVGAALPPRAGTEPPPVRPRVAVAPRQDTTPSADRPPRPTTPSDPVRELLDAISQRRQLLSAHLAEARRLSFANGELVIEAPPGDPWLADALSRPRNRGTLEEAIASIWGDNARWRLVESRQPAIARAPAMPVEPPPAADLSPTVQAVLDIFDGRIDSVDPPPGEEEEP